ncbi:CAM kinase, CDPK family CAM kinase TgTPK5, putative [Eimeria tenella]|uniref:non-specific serine/threonine protein kinase n=1 Tax=Eimeria tenella TaxID=5802 RepID=U6KHW9_EIMTE|nr:CAM kinase, CDPK family CAM kinase TgTPK5, putative [Eimeria tenella]CDJ37539.1 CAM kinase, CDPK family CAM kinase TgTPK5, putative [Eimeria tenella]|eukprot:XP_013228377.1 CAM kinase, CDPK family CAM kinase TgTPK5, putative [Eimeria tenella]
MCSSGKDKARIVDPFSENNDQMLRRLIGEGFTSISHGKNRVNLMQAGTGLEFVFKRLQPVVPLPDREWYSAVFRNYDVDQDGEIDREAFEDIILQYHAHHYEKVFQNSRRPGQTQLASYIMFPAHHGVCQVFKDYHFGEVVGKGSFGKVQLVTHKKTGAKRACKTIAIQSPEQWKLIKSEVELLKALNHPNIMKLFETYQDGYTIYLIIELCKGGPLFDRIVRHYEVMRSPLTEEQVCVWMRQILSACSYCHEKGVVHRDLKPENILFVDVHADSPLKIIDFGLSGTLNRLRETATEVKRRFGVSASIAKLFPIISGKNIIPWYFFY